MLLFSSVCNQFITAAYRMDGFRLYVTNTSIIPPDGYLCYEDPDPGLPNITQNISCNQLGKYVIYYDTKGDVLTNTGPVVELCYVAINGRLYMYLQNMLQYTVSSKNEFIT